MTIDDFIDKMRMEASSQHGIDLPEIIYPDDKIHRFGSGHKEKDEWYIAHTLGDRHLIVTYGSWRGEQEKYTWRSWTQDKEITKEEIEEYKNKLEEEKKEYETIQQEAKVKAKDYWDRAKECISHGYLTRKRVQPHGARVYEDRLLIPMYDAHNGSFLSFQSIWEDGTKRFFPGISTQRAYFVFGEINKDTEVFCGEGFATCASVYEATGKPVICCFSSHLLSSTSWILKKLGKIKEAHLLQDLGEAGEKVAKQWKEKKLGEIYKPDWKGKESKSDFNDLQQDLGLEEVKNQLITKIYLKFSAQEVLNRKAKPVEWSFENLFTKGSVNLLYAQAGVGKSMIAMHMCIAAQFGYNIFNFKVQKQRVLYLDAEMPFNQLKERWIQGYSAWEKYYGIQKKQGLNIIPWLDIEEEPDYIDNPINLYLPKSQRYLDPSIEDADFIVLDNFDKIVRLGSRKEDTAKTEEADWQTMFEWLRRWKAKGKTILIICHVNKTDGLRGTGKILDDADTAIELRGFKKEITREVFKDRLSIYFSIKKGRNILTENQQSFAISLKKDQQVDQDMKDNHSEFYTSWRQPWEFIDNETLGNAYDTIKKIQDIKKITN